MPSRSETQSVPQTVTASFGAALAGLAFAPAAEAAVADLAFTPATVSFGVGVPPATILASGGGFAGSFYASNTASYQVFGVNPSYPGSGFVGFRPATATPTISPGDGFTGLIYGPGTLVGTFDIGFLTTGGAVGWLRVAFAGIDGPVTFLDGAIETAAGTPITVGDSAVVPLPATLPLAGLALGAVGLRRKRAA